MSLHRPVLRVAAAAVPLVLVLGSTGMALAAKPPRTPVPTVTATPARASSTSTATFAWTTQASTTYTCSLDGSGYTGCASPKPYSGLADGQHTFALRARLGNGRPATYSYAWTVDTVPPPPPVVTPVPGPTSSTSASVQFSDADVSVAGFTCALDGGAASPCTSPHPYSGLSDGSHTVVVTAHDAAGNTASDEVSWVVDSQAPFLPVLTGPASPTKDTAAEVSIDAEAGAVLSCALDAEDATPCADPWTRTGLADGSHTLVVTAVDGAGNSATGSVTWVVDTDAPAPPSLVSAPAPVTNDPDFTVRFASTDLTVAGYDCTFAAVTTPCTSPFTPTVTPTNGPYSLEVRARDLAGNLSAPTTASWVFDNAAPSPAAFVSGPGTPSNVSDPAFDFVDTDTTTVAFECSLDGSAFATCAPGALSSIVAPATLALADGDHTLSVRAVDDVPNTSAAVDWHWTLDTTGPASQPRVPTGVPTDSGPVTSTPTFVFSSDDPAVAGFVCKLDGASAWTPCTSGYTPAVGDGAHTLQVATVDQAGNVGSPITYTWTLDTNAPVGVTTFPTTLTGAAKVAFPEAVLGVTPSTVRLLVAGTSTVVATAQSCRDAADGVASCGGEVRAVLLTPSSRLVPGQRYVVATSPAVHDAAGNAASSPATAYRALRVLQESEAALRQGWALRSSTAAYGGHYVQAHLTRASLAFAFRGTSVTWYSAKGPSMGTAKVYCGSTYKGTVNNYATTSSWRVARTVRCSSAVASNTLRVVATGLKGSRAGTGTNVVVDAVRVGTALSRDPALTQRWATGPNALASGGRYAVADRAGESVSLTFRGTSVTWRTLLGPGMGKAKVYLDGVYKGTFDQYAASTRAATRTWRTTDKVHTLKVVVTGTRRAGARGTRVVVDRLTVG